MKIDVPQEWMRQLAGLTVEGQREWIANMLPEDLLRLDAMFETWAARGQIEPREEGWRTWLMLAGRGFGKTRAGAEWVHRLAMGGKRRFALVAASIDEARSVMIEGKSGLLAVGKRHTSRLKWEPSLGRLKWPNGSEAMLYSGDNADGLRGPEHDFAWCVATHRLPAVPGDRGTAAAGAARQPGDRERLCRGRRRERCLGRP